MSHGISAFSVTGDANTFNGALKLLAPAGRTLRVVEFWMSTSKRDVTDYEHVQAQFSTEATAGTPAGTLTAAQIAGPPGVTPVATVQYGFSPWPTSLTVALDIVVETITPFGRGLRLPTGHEWEVAPGKAFFLGWDTPAAGRLYLEWEE